MTWLDLGLEGVVVVVEAAVVAHGVCGCGRGRSDYVLGVREGGKGDVVDRYAIKIIVYWVELDGGCRSQGILVILSRSNEEGWELQSHVPW